MKKFIITILLTLSLFSTNFVYATWTENIQVTTNNAWNTVENWVLTTLSSWTNFFAAWNTWESWLKNLLFRIARDAKILIYWLILLLWVIVVMKLIFSKGWDDDFKKLKRWVLRWSVWIIVMQTSTVVYSVLFDKWVDTTLANSFNKNLITPFINLLYMLAAFIFIFVAIIAFYKIITAWWNDEWIKKWKSTITQALIWFIVIKFAKVLVDNTFNPDCSNWTFIIYWWTKVCENITDNAKIIITIINWINWFLAVVIVLMIIYAWFLYITSGWAEDKQKKAKNIIIYTAIWLLILVASYLILTFFIYPNSTLR